MNFARAIGLAPRVSLFEERVLDLAATTTTGQGHRPATNIVITGLATVNLNRRITLERILRVRRTLSRLVIPTELPRGGVTNRVRCSKREKRLNLRQVRAVIGTVLLDSEPERPRLRCTDLIRRALIVIRLRILRHRCRLRINRRNKPDRLPIRRFLTAEVYINPVLITKTKFSSFYSHFVASSGMEG